MTPLRKWPFRTAALLPQKLAAVVPLCVSKNGLPQMARQCPISTPAPLPQPRQTSAFRLRREEKADSPDPATQEGGPPLCSYPPKNRPGAVLRGGLRLRSRQARRRGPCARLLTRAHPLNLVPPKGFLEIVNFCSRHPLWQRPARILWTWWG